MYNIGVKLTFENEADGNKMKRTDSEYDDGLAESIVAVPRVEKKGTLK